MEERRKDKRVAKRYKVNVLVFSGDKNKSTGEAKTKYSADISMSGIKLKSKTDYPLDTTMKLELYSRRTQRTLSVIGKVRWTKKLNKGKLYEVGLEFINTTPDKAYHLLDHIFGQKVK
jgi:c-di-GMP-binding flagellar brake protein YcgR